MIFGIVDWQTLSKSSTPLIYTSTILFGSVGAFMVGVGALISVSGSNESGSLGTARLSYAMSISGLFPRLFSNTHHKFKTPHVALIIQGIIAFVLSLYAEITSLISFSVFNLAFSFLLVCFSLIVLKKSNEHSLHGQNLLPVAGIAICIYLLYSTSTWDKVIGLIVIAAGIPIYAKFSPKTDIHHLKELFLSEEAIFARRLEQKSKFLANLVDICYRIYLKIKK